MASDPQQNIQDEQTPLRATEATDPNDVDAAFDNTKIQENDHCKTYMTFMVVGGVFLGIIAIGVVAYLMWPTPDAPITPVPTPPGLSDGQSLGTNPSAFFNNLIQLYQNDGKNETTANNLKTKI